MPICDGFDFFAASNTLALGVEVTNAEDPVELVMKDLLVLLFKGIFNELQIKSRCLPSPCSPNCTNRVCGDNQCEGTCSPGCPSVLALSIASNDF